MDDFINIIRNNKELTLGEPGNQKGIINRLQELKQNHLAMFPLDYIQIIRQINGIRSPFACLYGCLKQSNACFLDTVTINLKMNRKDKNSVIVIGHNAMDNLLYNHNKKRYEIRDIHTDELTDCFSGIKEALTYLFDL